MISNSGSDPTFQVLVVGASFWHLILQVCTNAEWIHKPCRRIEHVLRTIEHILWSTLQLEDGRSQCYVTFLSAEVLKIDVKLFDDDRPKLSGLFDRKTHKSQKLVWPMANRNFS